MSGKADKTVVLLGDSLTEHGQFPLTEALPGISLRNLGVSGDTTWGMLARLHAIWDPDPDFVFLLVGINDLGQGERPPDIVVRHVRLWEAILGEDKPPVLVLHPLLPVNPRRFPSGDWGLGNTAIFDLNFHLEVQASKKAIPILDFRGPLMDPMGDLKDEFTLDGLHLLPPAYEFWDKELRDFLKARIG
ncbi:MAG: GDSL-type esterase/lipase family protein [Deltaproteobacteria bacterium]|nr:GDSL-type esterase/lipase family protein [Deltaproteobacteria bacterium]